MNLQQRVDLSELYDREEDFSADLAQHLGALEIGQFEDAETEAMVGKRRADIVATGDDGTLVIENQFGKANWDHWGRLEAYARLKKANVAVLIAEGFEDLMIVTCRLRDEDSSVDWYLIEAQANSHGELSFHHVVGPSIDIQMERKADSEESEFWAPIQRGDHGALFKGMRLHGKRLVKPLDRMLLKLGVTTRESYAQIEFSSDLPEDQREAVIKRLEDADHKYKVSERTTKSVRLNFPVLDIGWVEKDRWDDIREALVKKGEELYHIIENSGA